MASKAGESSHNQASGPMRVLAVDLTTTDHDMNGVASHLYVGGAGNVVVQMADGTTVTLTAIAIGVWHRMQFQKIIKTSTTATLMVAGFIDP